MSLAAFMMTASISIPTVIDHETPMPLWYVEQICEKRVEQEGLPCAVITIDNRVCFAYMDMEGESSSVHCFPRDERIDE